MTIKYHNNRYWRNILRSFFLSLLLLSCGIYLFYLVADHKNNKRYFPIGNVSIPGEFYLDSLPLDLASEEYITFYLDSQITSETAVISKNPLSRYFNYQFTLPVRLEVTTDSGVDIIEKSFSSDQYTIFNNLNIEEHHGEIFLFIPIADLRYPIKNLKIIFKEDPNYKSEWFQPSLSATSSSSFLFQSFLMPYLLIFMGIIIMPVVILFSMISFALSRIIHEPRH